MYEKYVFVILNTRESNAIFKRTFEIIFKADKRFNQAKTEAKRLWEECPKEIEGDISAEVEEVFIQDVEPHHINLSCHLICIIFEFLALSKFDVGRARRCRYG